MSPLSFGAFDSRCMHVFPRESHVCSLVCVLDKTHDPDEESLEFTILVRYIVRPVWPGRRVCGGQHWRHAGWKLVQFMINTRYREGVTPESF